MEIDHIDYPVLFKLDMQGNKDGTQSSFTTTETGKSAGVQYTSANATGLDDTEIAKYGRGPILGWHTGGQNLAVVGMGSLDNASYWYYLTNFSSSAAATPNANTQLYMMLPLRYVERVWFPNE